MAHVSRVGGREQWRTREGRGVDALGRRDRDDVDARLGRPRRRAPRPRVDSPRRR